MPGCTTDNASATASISFQLDVNDPPVVTPIADLSSLEGASISIDISTAFTDIDPGDLLSFSATLAGTSALPGWLVIDATSGLLHRTAGQTAKAVQ